MVSCTPGPTQEDSKRLVNLLNLSKITESEADKIFKSTNCQLCQFLKSHVTNHHMNICPFPTKYGVTCSYNQAIDMQLLKTFFTRYTDCRKKNAWLDAEDVKKSADADKKAKTKKDEAIKEQAVTDAAGMTTVGPDGNDTKYTSAANKSFQKNLASQTLTLAPADSGCAAGTLDYF